MKHKCSLDFDDNDELDALIQSFGMSLIALSTSDDEQKQNEELTRKICSKLYMMCTKAALPRRIYFIPLYETLINQEANYLEQIIGKSLLNILLYI